MQGQGNKKIRSTIKFLITILLILLGSCCFVYEISRRITKLTDLPDTIHGMSLSGIVTRVLDGDGFEFYHVPRFRSSVYTTRDPVLTIRLAGIDAPECASPGMSAQPFSREAKHYLSDLVLGKQVKIKLIKTDRYNRLLAICFVEKSFERPVNVNLKMVEDGFACVYRGFDAEYGGMLEDFTAAEFSAKSNKLCTWARNDYGQDNLKILLDIMYFIVIMVIVNTILLICVFVYNISRRITKLTDLPDDIRGIWLSGIVTNVMDGDSFQFHHVPCFRSSEHTVNDPKLTIRLTGIGAPECAYNHRPAQPYSEEAKQYLSQLVFRKNVKLKLIRIDRYGRLLAVCFVKKYYIRSVNVNLEMVEHGLACVYRGLDAEYDGMLDVLMAAEFNAKFYKLGMWAYGRYARESFMFEKENWRINE